MELGKGRLLRTGLNALHQAIHPVHGLVWTDGHQVVLTDLQLHGGEARFGDSKVIGQFEHVCGVSWAPPGVADRPALLAVRHKKHVTVGQMCPGTAETSQWPLSRTCEIRESLPVLPQGCVWHPQGAVLAVLTAQDVSVFPSVHGDGPRVKADIDSKGLIHCACWTRDGRRLVVAVGSSLHSYIWDSAQKTLCRCSFYPVFDVDSQVRSIGATADSQVAVATELPLDKICGLNASETSDVSPGGEDTRLCASPVTDEVPTGDQGAVASETNFETSVSPRSSFSDPLDLTHIHFNSSKSEGSSLICLRKKDCFTGTGQDSSHLVLVTFEKEVTQTRKVTIPGILAPDLIAFNPKAQVVAVASNTYNVVFIYSVIPSRVPNTRRIQLERREKPKGICFLTDKLLLILVGRPKSTDAAFLTSSKTDQYILRLIVRDVTFEEEFPVTASGNQTGGSTLSPLVSKTDRKKRIESLSPDFCPPNRGVLTANGSGQSGRPGRTLIEEIRSPPAGVCDGEPVNRSLTRPPSSSTPPRTLTPEPPDWPPSKTVQREKEISRLSKEMEALSRTLTQVQRRLSELTDVLQKKSSAVYPLSQDPPYVHVAYQKSYCVGPVVEKRAVLLCNGKLKLSTVQQTFGLSLIEMLHDSHWILLCADSEGFIPLTFTATQEVTIRDGSTKAFTDSVSES